MIRVLLAATAPPTKEEAILVMIQNANKIGVWRPEDTDEDNARAALTEENPRKRSAWDSSICAQWATLVHFMGGAL